MQDRYVYQPLTEPGWIRLLHILPAETTGARLEGTLQQVQLSEHERYETLSYTWGQEEAHDSIFVEGKRIAITPNCSNAVRNLRRESSPRTFWIDAVCINQADKQEKGMQVRMMGDIYSKSDRTVVYLGAGDGTVHLLRNKIQIKTGGISFPPGWQEKVKAARERLLGRHWYHRKWIIQELLLSSAIIVQADKHEFTWAELETLDNRNLEIIKLAKKYLHPSSLSSMQVNGQNWDPKAKAAWEEMFEQGEVIAIGQQQTSNRANLPRWSKYRSPQQGFLMPPQLFDVLCLTSNFACKEPRDRLYAVLSLFAVKMELIVDYTCEEHEVYNSLTKELLSLGDTRMFWLEDRDSWRPRWNTSLSTLAEFVQQHSTADRISRPATDIGRLVKEVYQERRAGVISDYSESTWKVHGIQLGRVASVASQKFEHRTASPGEPSPGAAAHVRPLWEATLQSLRLNGDSDSETGLYPLAHIHQRNRATLEWFSRWSLDLFGKRSSPSSPRSVDETKAIRHAMAHHHGHVKFCKDMKMFVCDSNLVGIAPQTIRQDDVVFFLPGHTCPFVVLRAAGPQWQLVSLCWLGPLKLFPGCFNGESGRFFEKETWSMLEII